MFTTELIAGSGSSAVSLDLTTEIPISLNLSIADIREPEKRNGSYSKTIKLKGTKINNKFFEQTYNVNVATATWNANLKTACYILQQGSVVFEGYLRLMQINVTLVNNINDIEYEVSIFGDNNSLFAAIGDSKLEDLDLSTFNHVYSRVHIIQSWYIQIVQGGVYVPFALGNGYVYPLIDYGYNNFATNSFAVEHFRPAFYEKTYVDKIFSTAGKTYTSSFFNTEFFKKQIIPHNGEKFTMNASDLALREFNAGDSGAGTVTSTALQVSGNDWNTALLATNHTTSTFPCIWNDDTTGSFDDPSNLYSTSTGIITIASNDNYVLTANINYEVKFTAPAGTASVQKTMDNIWFKLLKSIDGGVTWTLDTVNYVLGNATFATSYMPGNYTFSLPVKTLYAGEKYKFHMAIMNQGGGLVRFLDAGSLPITTGSASVEVRMRSTATIGMKLATASYSPGQTLAINDAIPKDIKQRDFLTSIFKKYNLYVDLDADNPNNYLIETRDTFYANGSTRDWSKKLAWDKPINIKPMSELNWKTLIYRYKQDDADYYNKLYFDKYQEPYGSYKKVIVNDFVQQEVKNELIFSPTIVVDNPNNSLIIPKIFSYDGTTVKPTKHNIRSLMYNGHKTMTSGSWNFLSPISDILGGTVVTGYTFPECAMVGDTTWSASNPASTLSPTDSIEFGIPNEVYYTLGTNYTTNNLFNRFYSKQISEITDRDSKIIVAYFYLEPKDISQFDFRDSIFIDMEDSGAYYYVNKIMDYNPIEDKLTKVELIKIKTYDSYTPATVPVNIAETGLGNTGMSSNRFGTDPTVTKSGEGDNVMVGTNIASKSFGGLLNGRNIMVDINAERISVVNCQDVTVFSGVSGFTSMNCTGITMGASGHDVSLVNCKNLLISDFVYNYVGLGVHDKTVTTEDNNSVEIGTFVSGTVTSGKYTPRLYIIANIDTLTEYEATWMRAGNEVTVSGKFDVDPTLTATATTLDITLPFETTFTSTSHCGGTANASAVAGMSAAIIGAATNRARCSFISSDVTSRAMNYIFKYTIE